STAPSPTALDTLSLHDALPICLVGEILEPTAATGGVVPARSFDAQRAWLQHFGDERLGVAPLHLRHACTNRVSGKPAADEDDEADRKSTRLNSSHDQISYAVFC